MPWLSGMGQAVWQAGATLALTLGLVAGQVGLGLRMGWAYRAAEKARKAAGLAGSDGRASAAIVTACLLVETSGTTLLVLFLPSPSSISQSASPFEVMMAFVSALYWANLRPLQGQYPGPLRYFPIAVWDMGMVGVAWIHIILSFITPILLSRRYRSGLKEYLWRFK